MLSLRINDIHFPLPQGFAMPYEVLTNVLNLGAIEPSFTFPIELPATDQVMDFFGHPHLPQSVADMGIVYDNAQVLVDDNPVWTGVVELLKPNQYRYSLAFRFGSGYLTTMAREKSLRDTFAGEVITLSGETFHQHTIQWVQDAKDEYRVYVDGALYDVESTMNDPASVLPQLATDLATHPGIDTAVFDPGTFYLTITTVSAAVLVITAETFRPAYSDQGMIETPFDEYLDMTVTSISKLQITPDEKIFLPTLHLPNLYDDKALNYSGFVNVRDNGVYYYDKTPDPLDLVSTIIPCIKRRDIFLMIAEKFGLKLKLSAGFGQFSTINRGHEFVPRPIDKEMYAGAIAGNFSIDVPMADLLPDISVGQWLASLKVLACAVSTFDPRSATLRFSTLEDILAAQPKHDWTQYLVTINDGEPQKWNGLKVSFGSVDDQELADNAKLRDSLDYQGAVILEVDLVSKTATASKGHVWFVTSRNAYFEFDGVAWQFLSHNMDALYSDDAVDEISTEYVPLPDTLETHNGLTMLLPTAQVVGYSPPLGLTDQNLSPRIGIDRGSQASQEGPTYPMSSIGTYKASGGAISIINGLASTGKPALALEGQPLGIDTLYEDYIRLRKQYKRFIATLHLPQAVLEAYEHHDKVTIAGTNFLVEKILGEQSDSGIGLVEVTLVKVP